MTDNAATDKKPKVTYEPGYKELARMVAGLQKDIKKLDQCITLAGAQEYASKHKNWTAHEEDITGPHGKPDGIEEVFVCDAKGNLKVINGMGLSKTTSYPHRKAYRTQFPTKAARKAKSFADFMKDVSQPEISVRDLYKQSIFKDVYNSLKESIKQSGAEPMAMAQIFNKSFSAAFNYHIKLPILTQILGGDPDQFEDKVKNKALRSEQYKLKAKAAIEEILNSGDFSTLQAEIKQMISAVTDAVLGAHHELEAAPLATSQ